jgi:hypothetical protein
MASQMDFFEPFNAIVYNDRIEITSEGCNFIFYHQQRKFTSERLQPRKAGHHSVMLPQMLVQIS